MDKIPQPPIQHGNVFHRALLDAKNKAQVIDILCSHGSSYGWFSDMPDGLYEKLQALRTVSKPAEPEPEAIACKDPEWFREPPTCEVCEE